MQGPEHDQAPFLNNNSNTNNNKSNNGVMSRDGDDKIDDLPHHPLQPTTSNSILQTIDLGPPLTMTADSGLGGNVSNVSEMKPPGVMVVGRDLGSERNHGSQKHTPEFTRTSNPNLLDRSSANSASMHITVSDPVKRVSVRFSLFLFFFLFFYLVKSMCQKQCASTLHSLSISNSSGSRLHSWAYGFALRVPGFNNV